MFGEDGHLNDEGIALYSEALSLEKVEDLPLVIQQHIDNCLECRRQVGDASKAVPEFDLGDPIDESQVESSIFQSSHTSHDPSDLEENDLVSEAEEDIRALEAEEALSSKESQYDEEADGGNTGPEEPLEEDAAETQNVSADSEADSGVLEDLAEVLEDEAEDTVSAESADEDHAETALPDDAEAKPALEDEETDDAESDAYETQRYLPARETVQVDEAEVEYGEPEEEIDDTPSQNTPAIYYPPAESAAMIDDRYEVTPHSGRMETMKSYWKLVAGIAIGALLAFAALKFIGGSESSVYADRFNPSQDLEELASANRISSAINAFGPPRHVFSGNTVEFRWDGSGDTAIWLRILNNSEKEVHASMVENERYILAGGLMPGLYYWKLETENDLLYIGRLVVHEADGDGMTMENQRY